MNDTIIVLLTNVTDLVNIQASLSTSSKLKGIGTFVAGVAHEIKNPLVAVKTFTQLICKDWKNQDIRDKCKNIVLPQLNRIRRLAQSLDYSDWVEKSTFEPLDLSIILNNTKEWLAIDSRLDSRVSMSFSIEPNMMVFANQMALEQVFINLALNAMDAVRNTERPAIGFRIQSNELTKVVVDVEDNGGGISHHHQQQLFDPFFTTKDDGTGLGLSIVHQIMADHQGRIFLLKSDENGSTFRLVFPKLLRPKIRGKVT
jgi:C4-dicarboxylate-specific signal transduction histidine kinase